MDLGYPACRYLQEEKSRITTAWLFVIRRLIMDMSGMWLSTARATSGALGSTVCCSMVALVYVSYLGDAFSAFSRDQSPVRIDHVPDGTVVCCVFSRYRSLVLCRLLYTALRCIRIAPGSVGSTKHWACGGGGMWKSVWVYGRLGGA